MFDNNIAPNTGFELGIILKDVLKLTNKLKRQ
jgi:hypothetical protein